MKLERDGKVMEVCNDLQASVFIRNGYKPVVDKPVMPEPVKEEVVVEKPAPKKRNRKKAAAADDDDKRFTGLLEEE